MVSRICITKKSVAGRLDNEGGIIESDPNSNQTIIETEKFLTCEYCEIKNQTVRNDVDPFQDEVRLKTVKIIVCPGCYKGLKDEI
jgi:hypothetical protein